MLRQVGRSSEHTTKQIHEDIQFLLSNIRARENGLIFFLQRFSSDCKNFDQFTVFKEQFLQKQRIYSTQVNKILRKFLEDQQSQPQLHQFKRTFWIKVKSIIKVSLDRLRMLKLLNQPIFNRYQEIINMINKNYDEQRDLDQFGNVENLLKKRNVDALIYSRACFDSPGSEGKIGKNRSESVFKHSSKYSPKPLRLGQESLGNQDMEGMELLKFDDKNGENAEERMKSLNRYQGKKLLLESKNLSSKTAQKNYKKITKGLQKFQRCLEGAMQCIVQLNIDKKKTLKQTKQSLYDDLFNKNIPNHKMISKFLFGACGIARLLVKRKNLKAKKLISSKGSKNNQETKDMERKVKLKLIKDNKSKEKDKDKSREYDKQKDKEKGKDKDKDKQKVKEKFIQKCEKQRQRQRQRQKQKQKQRNKQKSKDRPQSSLTAQIRNIFQQQRRRMIQTTIILQDKKNSRYRKKIGNRLQKYTKIAKLIS